MTYTGFQILQIIYLTVIKTFKEVCNKVNNMLLYSHNNSVGMVVMLLFIVISKS